MIRTTLIALLASAALASGSAALTAPAHAGGSISIGITPTDPEHAQAMAAGMQIYSLINGAKNGTIQQNGFGNMAGIGQNGSGNTGIIVQEGDGHNGTIEQNGNNNTCGLFQFGENTDGQCLQNGDGQTSATVQFGW